MKVLKQSFDVPECTQITFEFSQAELLNSALAEKQRITLKAAEMSIEQAIIALAALYIANKKNPQKQRKYHAQTPNYL